MKKIAGDRLDEVPMDGDEAFQAEVLVSKFGLGLKDAREIVANYRGSWWEMEAEAWRLKSQQ